MKPKYSLVHLTAIDCPPPDFIRAAAKAGYDCVSLRTIPMGLKGEIPHDIAKDRHLFEETVRAAKETGIVINDTENARIYDGVDIKAYEPALEAAADLSLHHILSNIWVDDKAYYTEKFGELCSLAAGYGLTVNLEFVTWASVKNLPQAAELLNAVHCENTGIVVDALHFYRSGDTVEELKKCPTGWFHFVHLCDAPAEIPKDKEALIHTGREERLYPGEGAIDMKSILNVLPAGVIRGIEVPHLVRVNEYGVAEHARRALEAAKKYLGEE